jgi:hypothetical protein
MKLSILRVAVWAVATAGLALPATARAGVSLTAYPVLTEHTALLAGGLDTNAQVYLHWGTSNGGNDSGGWQNTQPLGSLGAGAFSAQLSSLDTFRLYYFAFRAVAGTNVSWTTPGSFRPQVQGILYGTGFEANELFPFNNGSLDGQGGPVPWRVKSGSATVQNATVAHGAQGIQASGALVDLGCVKTNPVVWLDAFYYDAGSTNNPLLPTNLTACAIFFSAANGLLALDGDGQGNGVFVQVAPTLPTNRFLRVSLRVDYTAQHYDVWVDGAQQRTGLGFKDNTVQRLSGAQLRTSQTGWLDDFSVSTWGLDADSDGDGLNDLDEAKFYGSYPLLADSTGCGMTDLQKVIAGLDPGDPNAVFTVQVGTDTNGIPQVTVPTITGRQYTLMRRATWDNSWENVPGMTGFAGDGNPWNYSETNGVPNYFYRGVVSYPGGVPKP